MNYSYGYPSTVNCSKSAQTAKDAITKHLPDQDLIEQRPSMGSEDFSFMLQKKPGAYIWLGNGPGESGCMLHNPHYDFNDDILVIGASYWLSLIY